MEHADAPPTGSIKRRLIDLSLLFASKSGAIIVGLLILPLFNRMLGPNLFGVVALIFSLQAFLLMLDFGMSTMVGRDLAVTDATPAQRYATWRAAEWAITFAYALLTLPAVLAAQLWGGPLDAGGALACMALFWSLTVQNIGQSALLARQRFAQAALIQMTGVLARNGLTAMALAWISPSLTCFAITQAAVAAAQMVVTRWRCIAVLRPEKRSRGKEGIKGEFAFALTLLRRGRPLVLFGLAGAAVMQLDKVIVSSLISYRDLAPYFLAATFCLTPLSVLAGPVAQFFQPRLLRAISAAEPTQTNSTLVQFIRSITACALLPTAAIWLLREPLIALWLPHSPDAALVVRYSTVLLPGVAIGAMGYVPFIMLVAHQDYRFQARFSLLLTIVTLTAVLVAALQGSVLAVCVVYSIYHTASTLGSWWRCIRLDTTKSGVAAAAARHAAIATLLLIGGTGCLATLTARSGFFS